MHENWQTKSNHALYHTPLFHTMPTIPNSSGGASLVEKLKQRQMIHRDRIKPWNNLRRSDNATVTPREKKNKKNPQNNNNDKKQPRNVVGFIVGAPTGAQAWFQPWATVQGLNSSRSRSILVLRVMPHNYSNLRVPLFRWERTLRNLCWMMYRLSTRKSPALPSRPHLGAGVHRCGNL